MKIGVSSYSFMQYIKSGKLNQVTCIDKARELGFDAIEFINLTPHDGSSVEEYAVKLRERAAEVGIEISAYTVGATLIQDTDELTEKELSRVKKEIDIAEILGVKKMRHDAYFSQNKYRSFDASLPELAKNCRILTEYAKTKGIRTMVENHGFCCQDSDRIERLFNAVNHENFGILVDMGNFLCVDENPVTAVSRLAPYAFHAHTKDFDTYGFDCPAEGCIVTRGCNKIRGTITGRGDVPVAQCVEILKRAGYDDVFSVEFEGPQDCIEALKDALAYLRRL